MQWLIDSVLALVCTLFLPYLLCDEGVNALLCLGVFGAVAVLFHATHWQKPRWRRALLDHLAGGLFALLTAFGFSLEKAGSVDYGSWQLWLAVAAYGHVFGQALSLMWGVLEKRELGPGGGRLIGALDWFLRKPWLVGLFILACWTPCYLSTYPGNFVYDATKEFQQLETGFLGDFPQLHSLLITALLRWSFEATGEYNTGIAVFTLGQMLLLSAIFSHMVWKLRRLGTNRVLLAALTLWWAAFPAVHVLVTSTVRDVLFAGLLTYSVFLLWLMCRDVGDFLGSWWKPVGPALVVVLTVFSRNNNTGLVMPLALCGVSALLFLLGGKKCWRGALVFAATALASFALLQNGLNAFCPITAQPSANASMAVYTQSLARAYTLEGESWTAGEKLAMIRYFDMDRLRYVPENGDSSKGRLRLETREETEEFKQFWLSMGRRYPGHYADAMLLNTRAMWFPGTVMNGYQQSGVGMYKDYEKCWFFFADLIEEPGVLDSKLPKVHNWYRDLSLNISFEKVPVVGLLFSVGFHFWLLLHCVFYALYRKERQLYLPLLVLLGYTVASAFVPLMLLRYFAALIFAFPLVAVFTLQPNPEMREN